MVPIQHIVSLTSNLNLSAALNSRENFLHSSWVDKTGCTLLSLAAARGYDDLVNCILQHLNFDENKPNMSGRAPLAEAAVNGHATTVKILLNYGVAIDSKDKDGNTPLALAASKGHANVVWQFIRRPDYDIEVNSKNKHGQTALSLAVKNRYSSVVEELCSRRNTDIYSEDNKIRTPMSFAVDTEDFNLVHLLLQGALQREGMYMISKASFERMVDLFLQLSEFYDEDLKSDNGQAAVDLIRIQESEIFNLFQRRPDIEKIYRQCYGHMLREEREWRRSNRGCPRRVNVGGKAPRIGKSCAL